MMLTRLALLAALVCSTLANSEDHDERDRRRLGSAVWWYLVDGMNATDIGAGFYISVASTNKTFDDYAIFDYDGGKWVEDNKKMAINVDVTGNGDTWIVNSAHEVWFRTDGFWTQLPNMLATDIGVGSGGQACITGVDPVPGGFTVYCFNTTTRWWDPYPGQGGVRVSVDRLGNPVIVDDTNNIFIFNSGTNSWQQLAGQAMDVGCGGDGSLWVVGNFPAVNGDGYQVYTYNFDTGNWISRYGSATRISVDNEGLPWIVTDTGAVYYRGAPASDLN